MAEVGIPAGARPCTRRNSSWRNGQSDDILLQDVAALAEAGCDSVKQDSYLLLPITGRVWCAVNMSCHLSLGKALA